MRNECLRVLEYAQRLEEVTSLPHLTATVAQVLAPFGVTSVSGNLITSPNHGLSPGILFGRRWSDWSQRYNREGFGHSDPAIRMLRDRSRPFTWSEARRRYPSRAADGVMEACAETTGSREGFVVPVRESDGTLLSAAFSGAELDLAGDARAALHLLGHYYATRGHELLHGLRLNLICPLTPRQLECLAWVHREKTDGEIAVILAISPRTVHHHVEAAMKALGAAKRGRAAFEAWRSGWLD